jgi:hypothetical protein
MIKALFVSLKIFHVITVIFYSIMIPTNWFDGGTDGGTGIQPADLRKTGWQSLPTRMILPNLDDHSIAMIN